MTGTHIEQSAQLQGFAQGVLHGLFGDLELPPWAQAELQVTRSELARVWHVHFGLRCCPHRLPLLLSGELLSGGPSVGTDQSIHVPGREWRCVVPIPDAQLMLEGKMAAARSLCDVILSEAYQVYGLDWRRGRRFTGVATPEPPCPLFDPKLSDAERLTFEDGALLECCFCWRSTHVRGPHHLVWGGANLMWVHGDCLLEALGASR